MPGRTLGRYILDRKLATGGMAEIWVAHQDGPAGFQKDVVLKKILPHLAEDQKFIDMFLDEARLAAQLTHPNIVQIFDLGEADGEHFIAMEFIDGRDMQAIIDRTITVGQEFSPAIAARIVADACTALDYAHNFTDREGTHVQLVHRDVSPQNILVSKDGIVKLVDFGVAKAATSTHKTQTGAVKGKLSYMSPEQISGKLVDARSDIFALGIVLYELVTGRRPFGHESELLAITAILNEQPQRPGEFIGSLPDELEQIIFRALEKDAADRFQSASEMQIALEQALRNMGAILTAREVRSYLEDLFSETPTGTIPALADLRTASALGQLTKVEHPSARTRLEFPGVPQDAAVPGGASAAIRGATSASVSAAASNEVYLHGALAEAANVAGSGAPPAVGQQSKKGVIIALVLVLAVLVAGAVALVLLLGPGSDPSSGDGPVAADVDEDVETDGSAAEDGHQLVDVGSDEAERASAAGDAAESERSDAAREDVAAHVANTEQEGSGEAAAPAELDVGEASGDGEGEEATNPVQAVANGTEATDDVGAAGALEAGASDEQTEVPAEPASEEGDGPEAEPVEERPREARTGTIQVVTPGGRGTIYIDGRRVGSYPGGSRFTVDAGSRSVRVVADDGREFRATVRVGGGSSERVRVRF